MTQKDPTKGFHKDMIRHISLNGFGKFIPSILKILVIKLSAKLSGLSICLAMWIKAFLLRVIKVFNKSRDLFFLIS